VLHEKLYFLANAGIALPVSGDNEAIMKRSVIRIIILFLNISIPLISVVKNSYLRDDVLSRAGL